MLHSLSRAAPLSLLLACQRAPPVTFLPAHEGLPPAHAGALPLVEIVSCLSGAPCTATRVYPDGALYLLPDLTGAWSPLATLQPYGLQGLHIALTQACEASGAPSTANSDGGVVTYRWAVAACTREVAIGGVEFGPYEALRSVQPAINLGLKPGR